MAHDSRNDPTVTPPTENANLDQITTLHLADIDCRIATELVRLHSRYRTHPTHQLHVLIHTYQRILRLLTDCRRDPDRMPD